MLGRMKMTLPPSARLAAGVVQGAGAGGGGVRQRGLGQPHTSGRDRAVERRLDVARWPARARTYCNSIHPGVTF